MSTSVRKISQNSGVPMSVVQRIEKKKSISPSKCTLAETLGQKMLTDVYNFLNRLQEDTMEIRFFLLQ